MSKIDTIKERVQKLLALSSSSDIHEAASALAFAQKLMVEYNLHASDLEEKASKPEMDFIEETTTGVSLTRKNLAATIAKHYRVEIYLHHMALGVNRIGIVGHEVDIMVFKQAFEYSYGCFLKFSKQFLKDNPTKSKSESLRVRNDYFVGFRKGLDDALTIAETEYALAIVSPPDVLAVIKSMKLTKSKSTMQVAGSSDARDQGYKNGRESVR